jgi:tRNA (cytidine32/uridine32-2'-O)-methyltransferase
MSRNIRIVLIETSHPGNIGASARAMKNMGLERLYLVAPKSYPNADATARASGADDILAAARVCATLDEALTGCGLVLGLSARLRSLAWPQIDARECGRLTVCESGHTEVALVFGREHSGLTNAELDRCQYLVHIPSNPDYGSLNLGAAVQVVAYEVAMALREQGGALVTATSAAPATAEDMERFYAHLQEVLLAIGFLDPQHPRHLMRRLRRLFNRAQPEPTEVNILRGILTAVTTFRKASSACPPEGN